jgi:hypothetical protein
MTSATVELVHAPERLLLKLQLLQPKQLFLHQALLISTPDPIFSH